MTAGHPRTVPGDLDLARRVGLAVEAAGDRKARDLVVLEIGEVSDFTDYFMICSGASKRQVLAITEGVLERLRDHGVRPLHVEGVTQGQWVLLDFGDFIIHVFDSERRGVYRLERLWSDGPDVTSDFLRAG